MKNIKINTIKHSSFKLQTYLDSELSNTEENSMFFNQKANTVNEFKMYLTSIHRSDKNCMFGCQDNDSLDHCMSCIAIFLNIWDS